MSISSVDSGPLHVRPEVDLNLSAEANRILYVLKKIISRAKLAGLLKEFTQNNGFLLNDILDSSSKFKVVENYQNHFGISLQNYSDFASLKYMPWPMNLRNSGLILASCSYDTSNSSGSLQSITKPKQSDTGSKEFDYDAEDSESLLEESSFLESEEHDKRKRINNKMAEVIYLLEENQEVRKLAANMEKELSPEMKFFIKCLTEFKKRIKIRLNENSAQYKTREKYMREVYEKNEKAKKEIKKLEEELLVTKTDANVCLIGKNILIKRHHNKIEKVKQNSEEVIDKKVCRSEKEMSVVWKSSIITQEKLKKEFQEISQQYSSLLKENLAIEKVLRTKRTKIENQVLGWIQKFDQEIGEKQAEEEEIQAQLDEETRGVLDIQSQLEEQEEEYDELMQEKAQFEEEMLDRRLYTFIMNRSARRIQRTFRLYKARKLAKKLSKKGRKGNKKSN